ncbi:MAG: DUF4340 domain-containing protein, partial [Candidatus Methylomirabilis sp.]|nr:DUF4340 domain-containing protein [Deltaproteobacteria bacterium]
MKLWRTLLALALAGALGAYAYWGVYLGKEKKEKAEAEEKKLLDVEADPIVRVSIDKDGKVVTIARKDAGAPGEKKAEEEGETPAPAKDEKWEVVEPLRADADDTQARVVTGAFKSLAREGKIEGADLALFGLDRPDLTVSVTTRGGKTETYAIGKKSPIGYKNYLRVGSTGEVMLVGGSFRSSVDKDLATLRDKRLFFFKRDDVRRIAVSQGGAETYALEQTDGKWTLARPVEAKASSTEAGKILTALTGLRVEEFHAEEAGDLAEYGLDAPRMAITVVSGESGTVETVSIGAESKHEHAYARRGDRPNVYAVKDKILVDLAKGADDLRETKPVSARKWDVGRIELSGPDVKATLEKESSGEWTLASEAGTPRAEKKKVEDLLSALVDLKAPGYVPGKPEDLAPLGLAEPWYTVTLSKVVRPFT